MANELMLPPYLYPARIDLEKMDTVGLFQPVFGYSTTQRIDYGATYWRAKVTFEKLTTSDRHALLAFLSAVGRNRAFYLPIYGEAQRGSGVFTELLTNNTFANGTTGWSSGSPFTLTAADRVLRSTRISNAVAVAGIAGTTSNTSVAQYAPYVFRVMVLGGQGTFADLALRVGVSWGGQDVAVVTGLSPGLLQLAFVPLFTAVYATVVQAASTSAVAGEHVYSPYLSVSRCALVDNGPNALLQSDDFTTTWVNTRSTDAANSTVSPDGTTTADSIIEDASASTSHYIDQGVTVAAAAADYSFTVALKLGTRTFARTSMIESTGSHECYVDVNLTTGALGSAAASGANWTNPRAFVVNMGNGWWAVTIIGRKASAGTTLTSRVYMADSLGGISYNGNGVSLIYAWRATLAQSSVPTRLVATTTTAVSATAQTGSALYTKGWLVSTNGLLLAGDFVNIMLPNGLHLARLTAVLNSDAAGLAYLQFEPALPESPADNAAVIPNFPLLKCVLTSVPSVKTYPPGYISDVDIEVAGVFG